MIYVMSDLHGCYEKYSKMLSLIELKGDDVLYILGDVVDRGQDGIKLLQDIMARKNVIILKGNHERNAEIILSQMMQPEPSEESLPGKRLKKQLNFWLSDGGQPTLDNFMMLSEKEKKEVLAYLKAMPFCKKVEVNGCNYFLSHTIPELECMPEKPELCLGRDLVYGEPDYEEVYFEDITLVTGHTPTELIDKNFKGKIWKGNNHIAVDCGAVFGNPLGCICLDTMEEFYVE